MTPYQFGRMSNKQRMLAGLNTLGFVNPPTTGLLQAPKLLSANGVTTTNAAGAKMFTSLSPVKSNVLAPPGGFKNVIGNTLQAPVVGTGIDARNSAAGSMLTASSDKLNYGGVLNTGGTALKPPALATHLPGSTITPGNPGVIQNPFLMAKTGGAFTPMNPKTVAPTFAPAATGTANSANDLARMQAAAAEAQAAEAARAAAARAALDQASADAARRAAEDALRQQSSGGGGSGYDVESPGFNPPGSMAPPQFLNPATALTPAKPFPTAMVVGGLFAAGVVAYLVFR